VSAEPASSSQRFGNDCAQRCHDDQTLTGEKQATSSRSSGQSISTSATQNSLRNRRNKRNRGLVANQAVHPVATHHPFVWTVLSSAPLFELHLNIPVHQGERQLRRRDVARHRQATEAAAAKSPRCGSVTHQRERIFCIKFRKADAGQYSISIPNAKNRDDDSS